ncbi:flagellar assembly protein FliO [Photobacterium aquae]|uniref:Flagellar protein n=1 Tax=Photobacterium aquae TaxID=1195763 RepID=A0A0J1H273_9GAMM|nr:flagellar biosynthetic protein FliO [Photobacterium aquae]KLV05866.1 flagellar assembly protein FliO [Photobacterium aquae]
MKTLALALLATLAMPAAAGTTTTAVTNAPDLNIATSVASLMLVLVIIVVLAWLLKRMRLPGVQGGPGGLKILRQIAVGQRERIVLLQVGEEQMVVGITQHNISLLSKLDTPLQPDETEGGNDFAAHLGKLMGKHGKQ